jgi:hypothetical protein
MDLHYIYGTAAVIVVVFLAHVLCRKFDPFAPIWLFFVGYLQIYVIQAISYHEWAVRTRGPELVSAANLRALWALVWFVVVYHLGIGRLFAPRLPRPPAAWSASAVGLLSPLLIVWGLFCAGISIRGGGEPVTSASEVSVFQAFPFVMLVAGCLLIVTGRTGEPGRPVFTACGLAVALAYIALWMFNGKRSHSLLGVLGTFCAFYIPRLRRPSWPILLATAFVGALAVTIAITWRYDRVHDRTVSGFVEFLAEFEPNAILRNLNVEAEESTPLTHETEEYGGFLIMMAAVPVLADYDYGTPYLRVFSTYIPRIAWPDKPVFGREQWVNAWIAASERKRSSTFTGPSIGLMGATQLNGGAWATAIVMACAAIVLRTAYDYFRIHAHVTWVQAWWCLFYFNAWLMVVTDDPLVWFYYNWGFTCLPFLGLLWLINSFGGRSREVPATESLDWASAHVDSRDPVEACA